MSDFTLQTYLMIVPYELRHFEKLLLMPNSDPSGLAGFFNAGEIVVARVPARLDVMGGIADYSGAHVCETVLGRGTLIALQPRTDRTLRIRTLQVGDRAGLPVETRIPLDAFREGEGLTGYQQVRELCQANPLASWAAYVGGSIFTLLKEEGVRLPFGFSLLLLSAVPMNVGIGSSAATEVAVMSGLSAHLGLSLDGNRLARLAQMAENHVVGAPCGIMDQIAVALGKQGKMVHILCRPGQVEGEVKIPEGTGFVGINSMVRHSVAANPYADTRIGAFMGRRMINHWRQAEGKAPLRYLTELEVEEYRQNYESRLPEYLTGSDFLAEFKTHDDAVTTIHPSASYRIKGPTTHPVEENQRVLDFMDCLREGDSGDESALIRAGELMFAAHQSYKENCDLSVDEVDFLVEAVRRRGPGSGLFGAKITGGGTGGTVAILGHQAALQKLVPEIARDYSRLIGRMPDIFEGTSPGAVEFGAVRYRFGHCGWQRVEEDQVRMKS